MRRILPAIAAENPKPNVHITNPMITIVRPFQRSVTREAIRSAYVRTLWGRYDAGGKLYVGKVVRILAERWVGMQESSLERDESRSMKIEVEMWVIYLGTWTKSRMFFWTLYFIPSISATAQESPHRRTYTSRHFRQMRHSFTNPTIFKNQKMYCWNVEQTSQALRKKWLLQTTYDRFRRNPRSLAFAIIPNLQPA